VSHSAPDALYEICAGGFHSSKLKGKRSKKYKEFRRQNEKKDKDRAR
jgi:hypothetical protein